MSVAHILSTKGRAVHTAMASDKLETIAKKHNYQPNLLARSLHPQCYQHNPGFLRFIEQSGLPFRAHEQFRKDDLEARSALYRQIAERIWNPADLLAGWQA